MLKITSTDSDNFEIISNAITALNASECFLSYFDKAEQSDKDTSGITVLIRNVKKFKKDLNKRKYIINIPEKLVIDSIEYLTSRHAPAACRKLTYTVIIKGHVDEDESGVNFIFILGGFNDSNIRIVKEDDITFNDSKCNCGNTVSKTDNLDELNDLEVDSAVEETITGE
jgi:hypothetical protein